MTQSARELWYALLAIILITALYLLVVIQLGSIPAASDFFGHSLGILGFILMLMTEFLYSQRKRSRRARWGKMSAWLQFHIFTGIVGPYLVFLHSSFKFNGLAGVVLFFTAVVVVSGFIGRYIYTALPRSADGVLLEFGDLNSLVKQAEDAIDSWAADFPETRRLLAAELGNLSGGEGSTLSLIFFRWREDFRAWLAWRRLFAQLTFAPRDQLVRLEKLLKKRRELQGQIAVLTTARRLLGLWHTIHVPLGVVLFTTAAIHIVAAIYYATLLR